MATSALKLHLKILRDLAELLLDSRSSDWRQRPPLSTHIYRLVCQYSLICVFAEICVTQYCFTIFKIYAIY